MNGTMAALGRKREAAPCDERGQLCASAEDATEVDISAPTDVAFQLTRVS